MWVALILLITLVAFTEAQNNPSCASKITPCVAYLNNSTAIPPDSCCQPLIEAFTDEGDCMENLLGTPGLLESFGIKRTDLLQIGRRCNTIATDTLKQGHKLNSTQILYSANFTFFLGFLRYEYGSYLAIWGSYGKPVWIANRNNPIKDEHLSVLIIDCQGKFVINGGRFEDPIVLYENEALSKSTNVGATLLDDGNLVLRLLKSDGSVEGTLWQSFDYPTDTLLRGMKLGVDHKNGKNWSLTVVLPFFGLFFHFWSVFYPRIRINNE